MKAGLVHSDRPTMTKEMAEKLAGGLEPLFSHREEGRSSLHRFHKWASKLPEREAAAIPPDIRKECFLAGLLSVAAVASIRWEVDRELTSTDATPTAAVPPFV